MLAFTIAFSTTNYYRSFPVCRRARPARRRSTKRTALYDAMSKYAEYFTPALDAELSAEQANVVEPQMHIFTLNQHERLYSSMVYSVHPPRHFRKAELIAVSSDTTSAMATTLPDGRITAPVGSRAAHALSEFAASGALVAIAPAVNSLPYERAVAALEALTTPMPSAGEITRMIVASLDDTPEMNAKDPEEFRVTAEGRWFDLARETVTKVNREQLNRVVKRLPLNPSQRRAIHRAVQSRLTLIQGPPGTGKTLTAANLIATAVSLGEGPVLACANSNVATDNLLRKVREATRNAKIVRIGRVSAIAEDQWKVSLDYLLERNARVRHARNALERGDIQVGELVELEQSVSRGILRTADIVVATCVSCGREEFKGLDFPLVVVDEATQATEPNVLIPLTATDRMARRLVLVGDHHQLPPTVLSQGAGEKLSFSLFLRLRSCRVGCELLQVQYRMHPQIAKFPSMHFYFGVLRDGVSCHERMLPVSFAGLAPKASKTSPKTSRALFYDITSGQEEESSSGGHKRRDTSYYNKQEVEAVAKIVHALRKIPQQSRNGNPSEVLDIGIISPYAAQVRLLRDAVDMTDNELEVNTVDAYQGREKDVIILSTVRSNPLAKMGFLQDWRRLNVALTRARCILIVVGHHSTIVSNPHWAAWVDFVKANGGFFAM